jgi:hypothetical protein
MHLSYELCLYVCEAYGRQFLWILRFSLPPFHDEPFSTTWKYFRKYFIMSQYFEIVLFVLETTSDTIRLFGIYRNLQRLKLRGKRLTLFLSNFLQDNHFRVPVGSTLSQSHQQEDGVPHASVLSVTLFSLPSTAYQARLVHGSRLSLSFICPLV